MLVTPSSRWSAIWLALRSLAWTLLLPGIFAGYLPWRYFGLAQVELDFGKPVHVLGLVCIGLGGGLLVACIWEFARSGRGTLAPIDPPKELVVRGLYRYVRNPMYLSVTTIVLGELLLTRSPGLLTYWVIWFATVNLFVIGYEEPTLRRIWRFLRAILSNPLVAGFRVSVRMNRATELCGNAISRGSGLLPSRARVEKPVCVGARHSPGDGNERSHSARRKDLLTFVPSRRRGGSDRLSQPNTA